MCLYVDKNATRKVRARKTNIIAYKVYEKLDNGRYRAPWANTLVRKNATTVHALPKKVTQRNLSIAKNGETKCRSITLGAIHTFCHLNDAEAYSRGYKHVVVVKVEIEPRDVVGVQVTYSERTYYQIAASKIKILEEVK